MRVGVNINREYNNLLKTVGNLQKIIKKFILILLKKFTGYSGDYVENFRGVANR